MNNKHKITIGRYILIYFISFLLLIMIYKYYLHEMWEYFLFDYNFSLFNLSISVFSIILFSFISPARNDARCYFLVIFMIVYIIPSLVIFTCAGRPTSSALAILLVCSVVYVLSAIPIPRVTMLRIDSDRFVWALVVLAIAVPVAYALLRGFSSFNLDIRLVYDFRRDQESSPGLFGYVSTITSKVIIPFAVVSCLASRRYFLLLIVIVANTFIFGFTGNRGVIFYPLVSMVAFFALRKESSIKYIMILFILSLLACLADAFLLYRFGSDFIWGWYSDLLIRRALMTPAQLDYFFVEYFLNHQWYFWSTSRITMGLIPSPYSVGPPLLIGDVFFNKPELSANVGFIGTGFANMGIYGALIYGAIVGLIISLLNQYGKYLGLPFVAAVMTVQVMTMLTGTDLLTLFVTHGMLFALILLAIYRPSQNGDIRHVDGGRRRLSGRQTFA